jgi:protein-S-isoprenylcysteine O-methyltransferase Ste14
MTRLERLFLWAGGAVFVLSLAWCAYMYVVAWAVPPRAGAAGAGRAVALNGLLFAVFALHHSLFARESIKSRIARVLPARLVRSLYVWTASVLLLVVLAFWQRVPGALYAAEGGRAAAHAALQLSGIWLIARSVRRIDPLELAGIRAAPRHEALQVGGPYRWVRHPLYLGWILVVFGTAHMTGDRFAFAAISTAYVLVAIPWEERSLLGAFGAAYAEYQRTVRWRVIPFLY